MDDNFRDLLIDLIQKFETLSAQLKNQVPTAEFISENDTVILLGVSKVTLNNWRKDNVLRKGEHYIKFNRSIRYKKNALLNFSN